jgi:hypothetical protein
MPCGAREGAWRRKVLRALGEEGRKRGFSRTQALVLTERGMS